MNTDRILLLDVSGSMTGLRIVRLREWVAKNAGDALLVTFATTVHVLDRGAPIPEPNGGTMLHLALDHVAQFKPGQVIVITDGDPNDPQACFNAAEKLPGIVDTIFVGDQYDSGAIKFCEKLARVNGGRSVVRDLAASQSLDCEQVRQMMALPSPVEL